jgi:hypothetical protein
MTEKQILHKFEQQDKKLDQIIKMISEGREDILSTGGVCDLLGISRTTLIKLDKQGKTIPSGLISLPAYNFIIMKNSTWVKTGLVVVAFLIAIFLYFKFDFETKNKGYLVLFFIAATFLSWLMKKVLDYIFDTSQWDKPTIKKYFSGQWKSEYQEPGHKKSGALLIEIKNKNEWWENGVHLWNVPDFKIENNHILFTKVGVDSPLRKKYNNLRIISSGERYTGNEDVDTTITYSKIFNPPQPIKENDAPFGRDTLGRPLDKNGNTKIEPVIESEPLSFTSDEMVEDPEIVFAGEWKITWWHGSTQYTIGKFIVVGNKWYEHGVLKFTVEGLKVHHDKLTFLKRGVPGNERLLYNDLTVEEKYKRYSGHEADVRILYEQTSPMRG